MWAYNNTYPDELYHHGVIGMKWGQHRAISDVRSNYDSAKKNKKVASKEYNEAFNKAMSNPLNSFTKKGNKKYNDLYDKAVAANKADVSYKIAKSNRNIAINKKTKELNTKTPFKEKLIYNTATRERAAKYIVDNNMSVAEATKKSHGDALRNTAIFVGVYGGIMASTLYKMNH